MVGLVKGLKEKLGEEIKKEDDKVRQRKYRDIEESVVDLGHEGKRHVVVGASKEKLSYVGFLASLGIKSKVAESQGLTVESFERLQGFPDGWTDVGLSDSVRYRLLGNAVSVPVVREVGKQFLVER